jgi:RNA polymerase primary sigma factor
MQKTAVMKAEEEYEVACKAFEGDEEARNKLVKANLRFVFTVAKMYSQDPETFNDLVSAGNIGLIDSAKKFDPHKGFKFISYAVWHIRKEMIEHLSKNYRTIRIPGNRNSIAVKAKEARSVIYSREGREATEEEMLDYIKEHLKNTEHLTGRDLVDILSADKKAWSLDQPLSEHGESESTLLDVYDGTVGSEQSVYDQENFKHIIGVLMSGLTSREVEVVERVHAIGNSLFPNSLTEVGISWGISTEAVRVVYRKALKKMQIKARKLKIDISSIF